MKISLVLAVAVFSMTGCVTNPTVPVPVDDNRFDGLWKGSGSLHEIQSSGWTCSGSDKPIYFRVKDRVATSLVNYPAAKFTVQVAESGNISFDYVSRVTENGIPREMRTQFWGELGSKTGSGDYRFSQCYGDWSVSKIGGGRKRGSPSASSSTIESSVTTGNERGKSTDYQKPYINILVVDVVEAGGKPKFRVKPGDVLEIIREKTCLNGHGICFKVRNPDTGEWGFVTENRMKQNHHIVR